MHIVLALLGLALTAYIALRRMGRGGGAAGVLMDGTSDVRNAARRLGFRRQADLHPVESIDDARIAIGALAVGFTELDDMPTAETRAQTQIALRKHLNLDAQAASEIAILGRWFITECGGPTPGVERLARKLRRIDGGAGFDTLNAVLSDVIEASGGTPNVRQAEALEDLNRVFRPL